MRRMVTSMAVPGRARRALRARLWDRLLTGGVKRWWGGGRPPTVPAAASEVRCAGAAPYHAPSCDGGRWLLGPAGSA